jgi:hypothetical protein
LISIKRFSRLRGEPSVDDLPAEFQRNINYEPPLDRHAGEAPAMSAADITDIVAFLRTLTDRFQSAQQAGATATSAMRTQFAVRATEDSRAE